VRMIRERRRSPGRRLAASKVAMSVGAVIIAPADGGW
jgi:hypothetical protein